MGSNTIAKLDSFKANLEQLKDFFAIQWEETIFPDAKEVLNPDYDLYLGAEENDLLIFLSLKDKEKLVGYFLGFKARTPHSKDETYVMQDSLFIHPDYRGGGGGIKLIRKLEEECKAQGISRILLCSRMHNDIGSLFERLDYVPSEIYYSKYVG
jgi:GNAT superfamily N-acetyltransferase